MKKAIIECHVGGRCYSQQEDGTDCPWGSVTAWEPPKRFIFAWQISAVWQFEPDMSQTSEIEVSFTLNPTEPPVSISNTATSNACLKGGEDARNGQLARWLGLYSRTLQAEGGSVKAVWLYRIAAIIFVLFTVGTLSGSSPSAPPTRRASPCGTP